MTDYHGNRGYKTPAPCKRGGMGEDRDRDHVVRQVHPGVPPSSPLFVSTCTARTTPQGGVPTFPSPHPRRPNSSPGLQYPHSSSVTNLYEQRRPESFAEFIYPPGQPGLDRWPDTGDAVCRLQAQQTLDYHPGDVRYGAVPDSQQRRPGLLLSPKSPVARSPAGASLPLRSPKRTISFDFPYSMDPRRREKIHRQIVQMAQEAGASDGVKVVEEPPEEEEESLPIFQLQDPPKPKFKRQLSADNSPPDSQTARTAVSPDSAAGRQHVQPGARMTSSSSLSARTPCTLSLLQTPSGNGAYPSSALSPKRLKSEHGTPLPCTPPKSPVVKQLATQVAETTLTKRGGGQVESRRNQTDVVHIFSRMGENANDRNNNNNNDSADGSKMKGGDSMSSSSDIGHGDEPDSRPKQKTESRASGNDVVSVLNMQQSQKPVEKTKLPPVPNAQTTRKPEDSMQTLEMLFKPKGDCGTSATRKQQSPTKNTSNFDRQSVRPDTESDPLIQKQVTGSSSENGSQKTDRTEPQTADKDFAPASRPQQATESASIQPGPSAAIPDLRGMTSLKKSEDMEIDSDPYLAELIGRLEDMQRRILSQHPAFAGQLAALKEDREGPATGQRSAGNQDRQNKETFKGTSTSSATTITSTSHGLSTEEESRTARLCRSKTNPFTFSSRDIEKAQTVLSTCEPPRNTPPPPHGHQEGREEVSGIEISGTETQSAGQFRLGELWISRARQNQANLNTTHRQLSDPGTRHPTSSTLKPVLEKVRSTPLRQFSEPARPHNQTGNPDPGESLKTPKPADRTLQHTAFHAEDCESLKLMEARPTFFLREDEKGASDTLYRSPTTPSLNQGCRVGGGSEPSRKRSEKSSPCERNFNRDLFWHAAYKQPHPGELHTATSHWMTSPRSQMYRQDRVPASAARQMLPEDDSVFQDVSAGPDGGGSPFKNPAFPSVVFGDRFPERSADRSSGSLMSADMSPRRPALRSHSNVEQSPNKAELEAMGQYRFLRSFSEHISDPKRLMEQLRAMPPADCEQLMEQLQGMLSRGTLSASFSSEKNSDLSSCSWTDRPRGVRRTLFQEMPDAMPAAEGYELAEWPQQGCYTYPPPLARRQHCSSPGCRDLRRSLSWIRDMERSGPSDVTRSRQPGDLDVTLECTQATAAAAHHHQYYTDTARTTTTTTTTTAHHPEILRAKIETYLQQILKSQLQTRPSGTSQADTTRWIAQAREIERLTEEASQLISTLSEHHRTVYDVLTGSVVIKVNCTTLPGVLDLREKFEAGVLQGMVDRLVKGERFLALTGAAEVKVTVSLSSAQCLACLEELAGSSLEAQTPVHNSTSKESSDIGFGMEKKNTEKETALQESRFAVSPLCDVTSFDAAHEWMTSPARLSPSLTSPSTPSKRHGKFVFGDCSARKAFSELNLSDGELTPTSPTSKKFFDTTLQKENSGLSPLVSPRVLPSPTARGRASLSDIMDANQELTGDKT